MKHISTLIHISVLLLSLTVLSDEKDKQKAKNDERYLYYTYELKDRFVKLLKANSERAVKYLEEIVVDGKHFKHSGISEKKKQHNYLLMCDLERIVNEINKEEFNEVFFRYYFVSTEKYMRLDLDGIIAMVVDKNYFYHLDNKTSSLKGFLYKHESRNKGDEVFVKYYLASGAAFEMILRRRNIGKQKVWLPVEQKLSHVSSHRLRDVGSEENRSRGWKWYDGGEQGNRSEQSEVRIELKAEGDKKKEEPDPTKEPGKPAKQSTTTKPDPWEN